MEKSRGLAISWIALGLSLIALILAFCKGYSCTDTFSILAIVFSILVTLLVTWNIFSFIDTTGQIKKIQNENEKLVTEIKEMRDKVYGYTEQAVADTKISLFNYLEFANEKNSDWLYLMLKTSAELTEYGVKNEDEEFVYNLNKKTLDIIKNNEDITLSKEQKKDIIKEINDTSLIEAIMAITEKTTDDSRLATKKAKKKQVLFRPKYMD